MFFEIHPTLVTNSHPKEQEQACKYKIQSLEFPAPFHPGTIVYIRKTQTDQKNRICRVEYIGEAVAERECRNAELGRDPEYLCNRNNQRHQQKGFGRTRWNEEVHDQYKCKGAEPDSREHRKSGKFLCYTYGKWIADSGSKPTAYGKKTHADTGKRIPSQADGQRNDDRNQRNAFFEGPDKRTEGHEEQGDDGQKLVAFLTESAGNSVQHIFHKITFLKTVKNASDHQEEDDNGNQSSASF